MSALSGSGGSATHVLELQPVHHTPHQHDVHLPRDSSSQGTKPLSSILSRIPRKVKSKGRSRVVAPETRTEDINEILPSPSVAVEELPRWNSPKINAYRTIATFWSFIIMGANDAAYGVGPRF